MCKLWYLSQISIFEEMSREEIREIDQLDTIHHFNWFTKNTLVQTPESARDASSWQASSIGRAAST
ncbi:hypothetical protein GCM10009865_28120 [Aeromicrobium ponti]